MALSRTGFSSGDRVRVRKSDSEYTGCRGTIAHESESLRGGATPLGHYVAIDGENGVTRPFLLEDLELLRPVVVRSGARSADRKAAK